MNDFTKATQETVEKMKQFVPQVTFNKNGYEIRAQVLEMAKDLAQFEYTAKFQGWEQTVQRDEKTGQVITTVELPQVPGADQVLAAAQKFYEFINQNTKK